MKVLKFHRAHVNDINTRRKTVTIRHKLDPEIAQGDYLQLVTAQNDVPIGQAIVQMRAEMSAEDIVNNYWFSHRNYESLDEFYAEMQEYYPDVDLESVEKFDAIRFSLIKNPGDMKQ